MAIESQNLLISILGLSAIVCGVALMNRRQLGIYDPYANKQLLRKGLDKPIIWLYYNDSDVNARNWMDFMGRSTRVLNQPYLNLCYESIVKQNGDHYRIEVIGGLTGLAERLGIENLPSSMQNMKRTIQQPELDFIRAAILAKYGGLWLTPGAICRKGFGELPKERNVFFGTDLDDSFSGKEGTRIPGFRCVWAYKSGHPVFEEMATAAYKRLEDGGGGLQVRNDAKWDYMQYAAQAVDTEVRAEEELGRKGRDGKRIELEDLLAANATEIMPFTVHQSVIYTPIPIEELGRRRNFGWFLRMSEEQILESDLAVSVLFREALGV